MEFEYKNLVLQLLSKNMYPVLQDFVVLDLYFKQIPEDIVSDTVHTYDSRYDRPLDVWKQKLSSFSISYLVGSSSSHLFHLHESKQIDSNPYPIDCRRIKITRSLIDTLLQRTSHTFEEELYHLLTLINFDIPKLTNVLNIDELTCTRLLPQFVRMWVYKFTTRTFTPSTVGQTIRSHFGPVNEILPIRLVRGQLACCKSQHTLLSLNNDLEVSLPAEYAPYTLHYVERAHALIPLAYNPLENPIVV